MCSDDYYRECELLITEAYRNVFDRKTDPSGSTFYTILLADGKATLNDIYRTLSDSIECKSKIRGVILDELNKKCESDTDLLFNFDRMRKKISKYTTILADRKRDFKGLKDIIKHDCSFC